MATAGLPLWSTTAATNGSADPAVGMAEGMAPSAVNDGVRALMASVAFWRNDLYGITTGGSSTAYTVATGSTFATAAAMSGVIFTIIPHATSGVSPTLAVDGLTTRALVTTTGVAISPGALLIGVPYFVKYVHASTEFVVFHSEIINALTADATPDAAADYVKTYDASASLHKKVLLANIPSNLPRGYIDGCVLSNAADATNDIAVTAGKCRDSTDTVDIIVSAFSTGKQLDANWAAGDAAGMRNSAVGIANGTYHLYAVRTAASSAADIYAHTSTTVATVLTALQAETGGASYVYARRIGSIMREGAAIVPFTQDGDYFERKTAIQSYGQANPGTSAVTGTLNVPTGIRVNAKIFAVGQQVTGATGSFVLISDLSSTDEVPSLTKCQLSSINSAAGFVVTDSGEFYVFTNTSAQIRLRTSYSDANFTLSASTRGWFDQRGKNQ